MQPFDSTNSSNPWLLNVNVKESIVGPDGQKLTAEYIWENQGEDRKNLMEWVFDYYRQKGFPYYNFSHEELKSCFKKLQKKDSQDVLNNKGELKNSSNQGLNAIKHFTSELFLKAKGGIKSNSCFDIFINDDKFKKVLMNRMGWKVTKEDGTERPYVFNITDKMIIQGMRSSGMAYSVSHFKPLIAKYIYEKFNAKKIFDPSAGWGARAIAAGALGIEYFGIDPLTSVHVNNIMAFFNISGQVIKGVSEEIEVYREIPKVDLVFSSIPYFDLEIYSDNITQSNNNFSNYEKWLLLYLNKTIENCLTILDGYFVVCMIDKVGNHNIAEDMIRLFGNNGLILEEVIPYKTSMSHLSKKRSTKKTYKNTEKVYVFKKN